MLDLQLHVFMKTVWRVYQLPQESVRGLDFFRAELRNGRGLEVFVEHFARTFPPLVVRGKAE